jgi:hypothetical protein
MAPHDHGGRIGARQPTGAEGRQGPDPASG